MASVISFPNSNSGSQIGVNEGIVNVQIHETLASTIDPLDKLPYAPGAQFDSYVDQHEEECLPGTRAEILHEIWRWGSSLKEKCIFWLNGMAGTGKSTISRTVARSFWEAEPKMLAASFFFKRGEADRGNARRLFPTIARQLASNIPQLGPSIKRAIHDDPEIAAKALKNQFDNLILRPLLSLEESEISVQSMVIVIDALDECDGDKDIRSILQLLPQLQRSSAIRLRIFLTSRPELPINMGFRSLASDDHKDLILHEIPEKVIKDDLVLFFNQRLLKIRKEREPSLPPDWPGETSIQKLVALSFPLFIFAATICRIFEDPYWDPVESLSEIITQRLNGSKLEGTYLPALSGILRRKSEKSERQLIKEFQQVVGSIVILESPLSVTSLARLIALPERFVHHTLIPLHSVLNVPDDVRLPVRLFHQSFRDFLLDPQTRDKTAFYVDKKEMHYQLTMNCLLVGRKLRRNICGLPSDGTQRAEVDPLIIDRFIPPELQYACRYWGHHLAQCGSMKGVINEAFGFLRKYFLYWVEAMSLLGLLSEVMNIIIAFPIQGGTHSAISEFLYDARRFILKNSQIASKAPLQIYCSGLIFAPRRSIIRKTFMNDLPTWACQLPQVEETWSAQLMVLETGLSGRENKVTFSSDGRMLLFTSYDHEIIQYWDTVTGDLHKTLELHSFPVFPFDISSDGRLIAGFVSGDTLILWDIAIGARWRTIGPNPLLRECKVKISADARLVACYGYGDYGILLWDTETGKLQHSLESDELDPVDYVIFSSNSRLLASFSGSRNINLWDTDKGILRQTVRGCDAVGLSSDGRLLASGHADTICLWDTETGKLKQSLDGIANGFYSLSFYLDAQLLVSEYSDSVKLWSIATGTLQQVLNYSSDSDGRSVALSLDGRQLAVVHYDGFVRIWEVLMFRPRDLVIDFKDEMLRPCNMTEDLPHPNAEEDEIWSLAFSPDGQLLASGSYRGAVRLWNTETSEEKWSVKCYKDSVNSVGFSFDSHLLASGHKSGNIVIWCTATGVAQRIITNGYSNRVSSLVFSPNGQLLASGSDNGAVQLWDITNSELRWNFKHNSFWIRSLVFSPNSQLLASGSDNGVVQIWDITNGGPWENFKHNSNWIESLVFSPDSQLLAFISSGKNFRPGDDTVWTWDLKTGPPYARLSSKEKIIALEFSRDGSRLKSNLGTICIHSSRDTNSTHFPHENIEILIENSEWIAFKGSRALWLPPDRRPTAFGSGEHLIAMRDNTLAIGHESGGVSIIGFCAE